MTSLSDSPTKVFPVLPLRDIVVFPSMVVPLFVGRERSVRALEEVVKREGRILMVTQKNGSVDDPKPDDLYRIGTVGSILQLLRLPDGTVKVLVEGVARAQIKDFLENHAFVQVVAELAAESPGERTDLEALYRTVLTQFEQYVKLNKKIQPETLATVSKISNPSLLADTIAAHMSIDIAQKQKILEMLTVSERLEHLFSVMEAEIAVLNTERRIRSRVKRQMEKTQREYYLNEQMKAIQKELGEEDGKDEIGELEGKIRKLRLSKEAREKALGELKKLRTMSAMSAEASVIRNYLDWIISLPWKKPTRILKDIMLAERILNEDHFGLDKVKDRILEYLAVQQRSRQMKGQILCIVGPPGVGKTSLAKSIARSTGRNFVRISLGGVRDEAEIRGHRRTYIGSMPGKLIQSMKKAKSSNPLILLDEIDKMGSDYRGDPAAALLEVLDPEQNNAFNDHYLEVDYDLSDVMFVATANSMNMPRPLLDRLEVIRIPGYTEDEKIGIARQHLIPKQTKMHGLKGDEWSISDEALREVIRYYTREAGVRNLEREIAGLTRKAVKDILMKGLPGVAVTPENLGKYAGVRKYSFGEAEKEDLVGMVTGLAWTEAGGDLLTVEAVSMPGKGKVSITGKLGDVMKESVEAAVSYVRSRSAAFGIIPPIFQTRDIHVHVPEGATPKDGPSAGIAITTAIVSMLTGIPVRRDVAMTGEVTLRGRVLAIGGLKEKLLAALRGGITTVLIPEENVKDLEDIPENVKRDIVIKPVAWVDDVLAAALTRSPEAVEWVESKDAAVSRPKAEVESGIVTH
ncbi:MAG: endopeptidase La [Alphaproteobacteria bacterium]|nr:endopeptidase La [Alphaproteobacteria bacterium]